MTPGFYYKTFMWPKSQWETYEKFIRKAAGLGRSSQLGDVDQYDHMNHHCDVMVVGAGAAGLSAALSASRAGARVLIADERSEFGGSLLFSDDNDIPGCMLASSISHYIKRFAVVPGNTLLLVTSNDTGYQCAFDWLDAGRSVAGIVDTRKAPDGTVTELALQRGITLYTGSAVIEARGKTRVHAGMVAPINEQATFVSGDVQYIECDTIASSGGWSPAVHLSCHTGSRPVWSDDIIGFVPGTTTEQRWVAGAVNGQQTLTHALEDGSVVGRDAASAAGVADAVSSAHATAQAPIQAGLANDTICAAMPVFVLPHTQARSRAPKQFVDMQNDVTAAGIEMTTREGFESIEHVKRYTALGFGTDQGKTGNINGMAVVANALGKTIAQTGTTVFRPNYTPVSFGVVAGAHTKELFDPKRFTPLHEWHLDNGAEFENVGQWKRPWYYPKGDESLEQAIAREQLAMRNSVGVLDASTLGKIDIQGKDAREFLGRVYSNSWAKLQPGHCRYGLMCGEDGMVMDDGVTACLAENHFHMTTTTGGAARVLSWLEIYHQTEWPELDVFFNSVTDHWAAMAIAGPNARKLLEKLTDDDVSADEFRFMQWKNATVAGVPARVFRISFTGDLSFEINVPAHYALMVWKALFKAGEEFGLTPYGTETMHVLRAEKGFIIAGQDTDGSMTPYDINHGWAVANTKPFSFIGKRGMNRADCLRSDRKQLVGLMTTNPKADLPEGAQAVRDPNEPIPMSMVGHVTSSYYSAYLERRIALGVIKDGLNRMGESVFFPLADGKCIEAKICSTVFLDPENLRQNV